jgi:4'-phosphopantetheinyl transferase EntD
MQFAAGRVAAHEALLSFDRSQTSVSVLRGEGGGPLFPDKIVWSIAHCPRLAVSVAARSERLRGIGIDIEKRSRTLSAKVIERISTERERAVYHPIEQENPEIWLKVFCVKEALFKACFGLLGRSLTFSDVSILFESDVLVRIHPESRFEERIQPRNRFQFEVVSFEYEQFFIATVFFTHGTGVLPL